MICQDGAYHQLLHTRQRILKSGGNPNTDAMCSACGPRPLSEFAIRRIGPRSSRPIAYCAACNKARRLEWGMRQRSASAPMVVEGN